MKDCQLNLRREHRIILQSSIILDLQYDSLCKRMTHSKTKDQMIMRHTFVCIPAPSVPPDRAHL